MCFEQLVAQNTFYHEYNSPYSNSPNDILEINDGFIICGVSDVYASSQQDAFLMRIDQFGGVIWSKVIDEEYVEHYNAIVDVGDGFIVGGRRWINFDSRNLLTKFDYDGNLIWEKYPGDTATLAYDNLIRDLAVVSDGIMVGTSGFDEISGTTNAILMKLDFDGNVIWEKKFGSDSTETRIDYLEKVQTNENGFYLKMISQNQTWDSFYYWIKVDENGNEVWRKNLKLYLPTTVDYDSLLYFKDVTVYDQNNFVAIFGKDNIDNYTTDIILIEFDQNGEEIEFSEFKSFKAIAGAEIYSNIDKDLFLLGQQDWDTIGDYYAEIFAAKFDFEKNLIWSNHYGHKDTNETQLSGIPTSDGGVLLGGRILNTTSPPYGYNSVLIKTDCRGELYWNYESCLSPETNELLVFPNPFQEYIIFHVPDAPKENEIVVRLYNVQGQLIDHFFFENTDVLRISTSAYSSGIYAYQIYLNTVKYRSGKILKTN